MCIYIHVHENKLKSHLLLCLKMSHIKILACVILIMMFLFGLAHLSASTCRGDRKAHNDFLVGIILVSLGFPGLLYCWAYKRYCVTDKIMVWVPAMTIFCLPVV